MDISKTHCSNCSEPMTVARMVCEPCGVVMEGEFEIPALALISNEDQVFVAAFIRHHGSIKKMGQIFGISYPTVKNRLRALSEKLDVSYAEPSENLRALEALEQGEISVEEALKRIT